MSEVGSRGTSGDGMPFALSTGAAQVFAKARELATRSRRTRITSSCLLFGFSELQREQPDTARFVRALLEGTGKYSNAFEGFLRDASTSGQPYNLEGIGLVSASTRAIYLSAGEIARRVTSAGYDVHQRHLFAAMLASPGPKTPFVHERLRDLGLELEQGVAHLTDRHQRVFPPAAARSGGPRKVG